MTPISFRLFGFPIHVQGGFLLFIGMIALLRLQSTTPLLDIALFCGVITLSLLVHELGHAFAARAFGVQVIGIQLAFMHGTATHQRTTHGRQLAISLAGPFAGFALGALALGISMVANAAGLPVRSAYSLLDYILSVNVVYGLFNLLPIYPLDGGHALRSAVSWSAGALVGARVSSGIGVVCALGLVAFGFTNGLMFLSAMAGYFAWINLTILRESWSR